MSRPLHQQVQLRWRLGRSATAGALGILGGSLLVALIAAFETPLADAGVRVLWVQLAAMASLGAIASLIGYTLTPPDLEGRALRWISNEAGLAYETAHAHGERPRSSERSERLFSEVATQARLSIRDVTPPSTPAWWLPLTAFAVGILIWSNVLAPQATPPATPSAAGPALEQSPAPTAPEGLPAADGELEPDVESEDSAATSDPDGPDAQGQPLEGDAPLGAPTQPGGSEGAVGERDALERFLSRLRERPEPETVALEARAVETPSEEGAEADDAETGEAGEAERSAESGEDEVAQTPPEGDPGSEDDPSRTPSSERESADVGEADGEAMGDPRDGEMASDEDVNGGPEQPFAEENGRDGGVGDPDSSLPEGDPTGEGGVQPGDDEAGAGIGEGAPDDPAIDVPSTALVDPLAPSSEAEPLPSIIGPGEESVVGGVQMEGAASESSGLLRADDPEFQRAVERGLLEGDVPAPYQEVIRNYFR